MATSRKAASQADPLDPWMSLSAAAVALGQTRLKVLSMAVKGELEAKHVAKRTVVSRESVDRLLAERE